MHHFIYPAEDTYITNRTNLDDKNFGIDEILQIGTSNIPQRVLNFTKDYVYANMIFNNQAFTYFTGIFTGSFTGTIQEATGSISGSNLDFSASYFSGSIDGVIQIVSASVVSGSLISGSLSGSIVAIYSTGIFTGSVSGSDVCLHGTGSGTDTRNEQNWTTTDVKFIDRALLGFDLTVVSESIAAGIIGNPQFFLKIKVCSEHELPINYSIFALPVSQSWNMGNGYLSDGGSDEGVSWRYRDNNYGTSWYHTIVSGSRPAIDFINNSASATASFGYGGGTWYTGSAFYAVQNFGYTTSDIDMDVTAIVMTWLSGSIPNQGFLLVSSDELISTGSGFTMKFFSRDSNTIYSPVLDVLWNDSQYVTGSISTGSVTISTSGSGISASVQSGSSMVIAGGVAGTFSSSALLTFTPYLPESSSFSGFVLGTGLSGNIAGLPVIGNVTGSMSTSQSLVNGPCGNSFSASIASGSFLNGVWAGCTFGAYYVDYKFENAYLTGSWTTASLLGAQVNIVLPSPIEPYAYAHVSGTYVSGIAVGLYTITGSTSASFVGQFIDGALIGAYLNFQLSGSVLTASYTYTSSVTFTSSVLSPLDIAQPFSINIQNMYPEYRMGDVVRMNVFGRKRFPLKYFGKATQQEQYLIPEFLPSSSFYAIKDEQTEEIVLDFDSYTQISCNTNGNYFFVDTTGFPQERYYRVLIRVQDEDEIYTIDTGKTFKIVRGGVKYPSNVSVFTWPLGIPYISASQP